MALRVKAHLYHPSALRPSIHRLELTEPFTYDGLAEILDKLVEGGSVVNLRWRDEEKDLIVLRTDDDLRLAVSHIRELGENSLSLHGEVVLRPPTEAATTAECMAEARGEVSQTEPTEEAPARKDKKWPMRELPGGGKFSGYVRTTDSEGKTVERELTLDEAQDLMRTPVLPTCTQMLGGLDDMFGWPAFRRPQYPAGACHRSRCAGVACPQPLFLSYFY